MGRWRRCCCGLARRTHFIATWVALAVGTGLAAVAATLVGIPAATIVARESGREDPGFVVVDEVAGQWIALIAVRPDWRHAVLALVLFRLFDIWKPWPIRRLERLPEGTGIMLDDVAAGLLALVCGLVASEVGLSLRLADALRARLGVT